MGVNDRNDGDRNDQDEADDLLDLVAAYAADAVGDDDAAVVETYLATSSTAARLEQALRSSAGSYATALLPETEWQAPDELRSRVLDAALERRPGRPLVPSTSVVTHRLETERARLLLRRLTTEQWTAVVDPPELQGWTVHQLVAHLASNESLLARLLDIAEPLAPERDNDNEPRTAEVQARHRSMSPAETLAEYEAFVAAVDARVTAMSHDELEQNIPWWGLPMRISSALIVRALETWTHCDDIRRALSLPPIRPAAPDLAAMSARSAEWVPIMLASDDDPVTPGLATLVLTGPGGGVHTVQLGSEAAAADSRPQFSLTLDVVDYCRAIARRIDPADLPHIASGDVVLAERLVSALPALSAV
jgi:uncharacterized protein (TIGR03083 family)